MLSQRCEPDYTDSQPSNTALDVLDTPVPHLFGCNTPISENDVISIQKGLSTVELHLSDLQRSQTNDLHRIHACNRFIREHRLLLSSWIRRVPPEIIVDIFLQCLDTNHKSPPWYLSHVCRYWRDLALRTPQLWTRVPLPALSNRVKVARELVAFMPEYLARSKDQTIAFQWEGNWNPETLDEDDEFEDPICGQSDVVLDLLIQHAERWGRVSIISGGWNPKFEQQLALLRNRLPRLYHLELDVDSLHVISIEAFRTAPLLKEVKLHIPLDRGDPESIRDFIQWSEIKRLKFMIPSFIVPPHLALCRQLTALDLRYIGSQVATFESEKLELPNLQTLSLRSCSDLSSAHFDLLQSPALEDLRVFCTSMEKPQPWESFLRLLTRHAKSLKRLTIGYIQSAYHASVPGPSADLALLPFDQLTHLEYLRLQYPPLDRLSELLRSISRGTLPFRAQTLHIFLNTLSRLPQPCVGGFSQEVRAVVKWAETPGSGSQLRRIEITPGIVNNYWELLSALEGWPQEYPSDIAESVISLVSCERTLGSIHPFIYSDPDSVILRVFDGGDAKKIEHCLGVIEHSSIQVHLLCVSILVALECLHHLTTQQSTRVHFSIYALSKMSPDQFTPSESSIPERAATLVEKWKLLFEKDIPNRRWLHYGCQKLVYVPADDSK